MPDGEFYTIKNPLRHDGTSQNQRQPAALDPAFIKVDERTIQDFLDFACDFAKQVYYYNRENRIEGDWEDFWSYDLSFIIAAIQNTNPNYDKQLFFQIHESEPTTEGLVQLFRKTLDLAKKLDQWLQDLTSGNDFRDQISRLIRANLGSFLQQIGAYDKGAYSELGTKEYPEPNASDYTVFSSTWNLGDFNELKADTNLFKPKWEPAFSDELPPNPAEAEKLENAYDKLKTLFSDVYNVYFQVIHLAARWFDKSLLKADHEPHIALFIAFLHLYQKAQDDLNKISDKHLNFYYKNVLEIQVFV